MGSSREESPDWLRSYQPPTGSVMTLSSDSESSQGDQHLQDKDLSDHGKPSHGEFSLSPEEDENTTTFDHNEGRSSILKSTKGSPRIGSGGSRVYTKKRKSSTVKKDETGRAVKAEPIKKKLTKQHIKPHTTKNVWALSSDSESLPAKSTEIEDSDDNENSSSPSRTKIQGNTLESCDLPVANIGEPVSKDVLGDKSPKQQVKTDRKPLMKGEEEIVKVPEEGDMETHMEPLQVSSSTIPLVLPEKVQRSKVLVECDGESIDMSGDMGAVGRVMISDTPSGHEMYLDLKGTMYKTTIVPSHTFCIVNFGPSEAKIEAIMNDFIQLKPQSNVFHAETMVEGTLDGFSFDSEDEGLNLPKSTNQNTETEDAELVNGKRKGKAEKNLGTTKKRVKTAAAKPPKKVKKKPQPPKRASNKK